MRFSGLTCVELKQINQQTIDLLQSRRMQASGGTKKAEDKSPATEPLVLDNAKFSRNEIRQALISAKGKIS